jgi:hypothetical protein
MLKAAFSSWSSAELVILSLLHQEIFIMAVQGNYFDGTYLNSRELHADPH